MTVTKFFPSSVFQAQKCILLYDNHVTHNTPRVTPGVPCDHHQRSGRLYPWIRPTHPTEERTETTGLPDRLRPWMEHCPAEKDLHLLSSSAPLFVRTATPGGEGIQIGMRLRFSLTVFGLLPPDDIVRIPHGGVARRVAGHERKAHDVAHRVRCRPSAGRAGLPKH